MTTSFLDRPVDTDRETLDDEAVIQGTVTLSGSPVSGAYVRLVHPTAGLTAEVPTDTAGRFRFFAAPGRWNVLALAPGATVDRAVAVGTGQVSDVLVAL